MSVYQFLIQRALDTVHHRVRGRECDDHTTLFLHTISPLYSVRGRDLILSGERDTLGSCLRGLSVLLQIMSVYIYDIV